MRIHQIIFILISPIYLLHGQQEILKEDIFLNRKFSQDWVFGLNSMKDGSHYTTLERGEHVAIEKYNYETGEKVSTILNSSDIENVKFNNYSFNHNESLILLETETESIYRYSKESIIYLFNTRTKEIVQIFDKKVQLPEFSPNSKQKSS